MRNYCNENLNRYQEPAKFKFSSKYIEHSMTQGWKFLITTHLAVTLDDYIYEVPPGVERDRRVKDMALKMIDVVKELH